MFATTGVKLVSGFKQSWLITSSLPFSRLEGEGEEVGSSGTDILVEENHSLVWELYEDHGFDNGRLQKEGLLKLK